MTLQKQGEEQKAEKANINQLEFMKQPDDIYMTSLAYICASICGNDTKTPGTSRDTKSQRI
jgi:hypothetical protein